MRFIDEIAKRFLDNMSDRLIRRSLENGYTMYGLPGRSGLQHIQGDDWRSDPQFFNQIPQQVVSIVIAPMEAALESTPTVAEVPLLGCPDNAGYQLAVLGESYFAHTLPVDAGGVVGDLEWVDDSDSDTVANLKAAFDFAAGTARVNNEVWRGRQIFDPGDTLNMEMATDGALSTPGQGAALITEFSVLQRMVWG